MENSALGSFGKRLLAWVVLIRRGLLALKLVPARRRPRHGAALGRDDRRRRHGGALGAAPHLMPYLVLCLCFGLAGGIVGQDQGVVVLPLVPDLGARAGRSGCCRGVAYRYERDEVRRQCPGCGKIVKLHDALCTRCGTELEFPEVAIEPESRDAPRRR